MGHIRTCSTSSDLGSHLRKDVNVRDNAEKQIGEVQRFSIGYNIRQFVLCRDFRRLYSSFSRLQPDLKEYQRLAGLDEVRYAASSVERNNGGRKRYAQASRRDVRKSSTIHKHNAGPWQQMYFDGTVSSILFLLLLFALPSSRGG